MLMNVTVAWMMKTPPPCDRIPQKVPGNYLVQGGDGKTFRERFKSRCISRTAKHGRSHVSSRKLPATVIVKSNLSANDEVALFLERGDGETFQERFKSRRISRDSENTRDHTSFPGNYSQRGDGRTFRERFKSRANLTSLA